MTVFCSLLHLRFVPEEALVDLYGMYCATKDDWLCKQRGAAHFSKPLVYIYSSSIWHICLLNCIPNWILSCPHMHSQHPLLQCDSWLLEETSISDTCPCLACQWAPPAILVRYIPTWLLPHWNVTPVCFKSICCFQMYCVSHWEQSLFVDKRPFLRRYARMPSIPPNITGPISSSDIWHSEILAIAFKKLPYAHFGASF